MSQGTQRTCLHPRINCCLVSERTFTLQELRAYDGHDDNTPLYIAAKVWETDMLYTLHPIHLALPLLQARRIIDNILALQSYIKMDMGMWA